MFSFEKINKANKENGACHVCGDRVALGYYYNGHCCVSCRFFFNRNAAKQMSLKCLKSGDCPIDSVSRKNCPKCRLNKCFTIGMKITPAIESNFESKKINVNNNVDLPNIYLKIENLLELDIRKIILEDDQKKNCENIFPENLNYCSKMRRNYASNLTQYEKRLIDEVQNAMSVSFENERNLPVAGEVTNIADAFNWPTRYSKRIVKFCKHITAFKCLKSEDQLSLLKPFYMKILMIRFTFASDHDKNGFYVLENEDGTHSTFINIDLSKQFECQQVIQENRESNHLLAQEMENDPVIRDLVIAQVLFKTEENLIFQEVVRKQYFVYCRLLRRFLIHKYENIQLADKKFVKLMNALVKFEQLMSNFAVILNEIQLDQLTDWLVDLYLQ